MTFSRLNFRRVDSIANSFSTRVSRLPRDDWIRSIKSSTTYSSPLPPEPPSSPLSSLCRILNDFFLKDSIFPDRSIAPPIRAGKMERGIGFHARVLEAKARIIERVLDNNYPPWGWRLPLIGGGSCFEFFFFFFF